MTPAELNAVNQSAEVAKGFLARILGPSADELGLLIADNFKVRRLKNQIKNLEKVKKIVDEENISIKQVNLKVLVPYLENVSLEEDEDLQGKWASLFANYLDSEKLMSTTVYPSILSQLSSIDIEILDYISKAGAKTINLNPFSNPASEKWSFEEVTNLLRLGLLEEIYQYRTEDTKVDHSGRTGELAVMQIGTGKYFLTDFGNEFVLACSR